MAAHQNNPDGPGIRPPVQKQATNTGFLLSAVIIALVSFAVYFNVLFNGFVYDDNLQVLNNPWMRDVTYLPDIFTNSVWSFAHKVSNYYRPLMHVFYMLTYHIFGLRPWGFHLVNIIFHAGASVMVFFITARLLDEDAAMRETGMPGRTEYPHVRFFSKITIRQSSFFAFIAALLFAAHPIHTEAVAWVAALPELSFAFFYLLSFYFYMRGKEGLRSGYILSLASFFLSALSKEPGLTLPFVLIAYDYAFRRPFLPEMDAAKAGAGGSFLRRYAPYFMVAAICLGLRFNALASIAPFEERTGLSPWQLAINVFPLFAEYLRDPFFPFDLNFWHMFHPLDTLITAKGIFSAAITIAFIFGVFWSWKKNRVAFLGLLFFAVPLSPAFYITGIVGKPYAERYLYLPSFGFVLLAAACLSLLSRKKPGYAVAAWLVALALSALYSTHTIERNFIWKNDISLFTETVRKSPDAVYPHGLLGNALSAVGRYDEAIEQFRIITLNLDPDSLQTRKSLGLALLKKGAPAAAVEEYQRALAIAPDDIGVHIGLASAYAQAGLPDKAIEQSRILKELDPNYLDAYIERGNALVRKGQINEAVEQYKEALEIDPDYAVAHYGLGNAYSKAGRLDKAIEHFRAAVRLKPDSASYHNILGVTYGEKGIYNEAISEFGTAVQLAPAEPAYRKNLDRAYKLKNSAGGAHGGK